MSDTPHNPPAFPHPEPRNPDLTIVAPGMTLRDWFAGQATPIIAVIARLRAANGESTSEEEVAAACYGFADAFLAERAK